MNIRELIAYTEKFLRDCGHIQPLTLARHSIMMSVTKNDLFVELAILNKLAISPVGVFVKIDDSVICENPIGVVELNKYLPMLIALEQTKNTANQEATDGLRRKIAKFREKHKFMVKWEG